MAVPSTAADLSTTAASNSPAGSESIGTSLDDYLRAIQAIIKSENSKGSDIASASTIDVPSAGSYFVVTGTTGISAISDDWTGRTVYLKFSDAVTLTHSAGLILPTGANITTAAGDVFGFNNESTGVWRCTFYQPATGLQAKMASASQVEMETGTEAALRAMSPLRVAQAISALATSEVVQEVEATPVATVVNCSTTIPRDDTIPQNTEGTEVITVSITPTSATNRIRIEAECSGSPNNNVHVISALFQDTTANALAVSSVFASASDESRTLRVVHEMAAGTTSATTFKLRIGASSAASFYVNGNSAGSRLFGGVSAARLRVTEIKV